MSQMPDWISVAQACPTASDNPSHGFPIILHPTSTSVSLFAAAKDPLRMFALPIAYKTMPSTVRIAGDESCLVSQWNRFDPSRSAACWFMLAYCL